jgi:hypothetical protein
MLKVYTDAYFNAMAYAQAYALGGLLPPIPLDTAKVGLFNGNPGLSRSTVLADLSPTVFSGYAAKTITWDAAPIRDVEGKWTLRGVTAAPFQSTGPLTGDTVTGLFIENSGATTLYMAEFFDTPIQINAVAQIIQVTLFCRPDGNGGLDVVIGP